MRFRLRLPAATLLLVLVSCLNAVSQSEGDTYVFHPNLEVQIASLPSTVAASKGQSAVIVASVATVVMDPEVCCGRNSALEDEAASVNTLSLKELGEKVRGKHYLNSGASILVADQYWPGASVNAEVIVGSLTAQRPLLMDWGGHLYVLYGAVFDEYKYNSGVTMHNIRKLLLVDTRYADDRRYLAFDRQTDDWGKVAGLLTLTITR